jgi:hypothetical protein
VVIAIAVPSIAGVLTHGAFYRLMLATGLATLGTFGFGAIGILGIAVRPSRQTGWRMIRLSLLCLLGGLLFHGGAKAAVEWDLWRAKRYVVSSVVPHLERIRAREGRYPDWSPLDEHLPGSPWLVRHGMGYSRDPDGLAFSLSLSSPMVCGRQDLYSSDGVWRREETPCWF